jgi:hypothetical protein
MPASRTVLRALLTKVAGQKLSMETQQMSAAGMIAIPLAQLIWEQRPISVIALTMGNVL